MHNKSLVKASALNTKSSSKAAVTVPKSNRFGTLTAAFLLALALIVVPAQQAFSHDYLMGSNPQDGATLDTHPAQVVLSFNNGIQTLGAQLVILNEGETVLSSGEPTVEGKNVSYDIPSDLGNGTFTINWRVVSSDSHPIEGAIAYSVTGEPEPEVAAPQSQETNTPEATETAGGNEPSSESSVDAPEETDLEIGDRTPGLPWPGIIIGGAIGLIVGIVLLILGKRKNK